MSQEAVNFELLCEKTHRWLNVTWSLWALLLRDSNRPDRVDSDDFERSLENFCNVLDWRLHDKITALEFTFLFKEWVEGEGDAQVQPAVGRDAADEAFRGLGILRKICEARRYEESDLDVRLSMVLSVIEQSCLLGLPPDLKDPGRWMEAGMELFFALDTIGNGYLYMDQFFFLSACMAVGLQSWSNWEELAADLSLETVSSIAASMVQECGCEWLFDDQHGMPAGNVHPDASVPVVTPPMFVNMLMDKGLETAALDNLLAHTKVCVTKPNANPP